MICVLFKGIASGMFNRMRVKMYIYSMLKSIEKH